MTVPQDFWCTSLFISQLHLGPWSSGVELFPYGFTFAVILTLYFFLCCIPNANKKKILKLSMFEKWILYTFIRGILIYVHFEFSVPWKAYSEILIFEILIRVAVVIPRCCRQCQKFVSVVAISAEQWMALLPTTPIIFPRCGPQHGKMIGVVAYTAEKLSALLTTTRKNVPTTIDTLSPPPPPRYASDS